MIELAKEVAYDALKLIFLLFTISLIVGFFRTYISHQKLRKNLIMRRGFKGNFIASCLGSLTHFSLGSSIKVFLNLLESGVPLGIALSFLISSPIVNEYVAILMIVFFGWKITLVYIISGILIGTFGGLILSKFNLEKYFRKRIKKIDLEVERKFSIKNRLKIGLNESWSLIKNIWIFLILGVFISAGIKYFLSGDRILSIVDNLGYWGIPIAILIGVPFPGSGAAIIPIALGLFEKGIPLGTAIGFLMAVVGLSIRMGRELRKVMETKLIILFFSVITISIMILGYLINFIQAL